MVITWTGEQNFLLKTKNTNVKIGDKNFLNELAITQPGEYEVGGTQLDLIDGIIQICMDGMIIGHIRKGKAMSDEELSQLSGIDILLIGVGGGEFTETKTALELIAQIDPSIVIPMYNGNLEGFTKEEGVSSNSQDELKITKAELPQEERQVVVLNAHR